MKTITIAALAEQVSARANISKKEARLVVQALIDVTRDALLEGDDVTVDLEEVGIFTAKVLSRPACKPSTNERWIATRRAIKFKPGQALA